MMDHSPGIWLSLHPERIGKYEIVGALGHGAMGEVFRARDTVLNREVALKRITASLAADETARKRFQREAQSVARLSHPNIIMIYELGYEAEQLYMAMELLEGNNFKQELARRPLSLEQKLEVVEQTLEGLAYAHRRGVVHRDLKPANIHLVPRPDRPKVKIVDFGLAKLSGSDMTATGTVMGTPHYMSPEQVRGHKVDARSDVFSAGAVLYEALSGRRPFEAESMHAVLFKVIQDDPPPLAEVAPAVPRPLVAVVDRALTKDPVLRYADAGEMLAALRRARQAVAEGPGAAEFERTILVAENEPGPPGAVRSEAGAPSLFSGRLETGSRRGLLVGIAIGVVLVLALAGGAWLVVSRPEAPSSQPEVHSLAQAVVASQVEVAQRRLDEGDAAAALAQAENALRLDRGNAPAQRVREEARTALREAEQARARLLAAGGDRTAKAAAAFELMRVQPHDAQAREAAREAGPAFRAHARQAESLARDARAAAESAGASRAAAFGDGEALERQARSELQRGDPVSAARRFLEARRSFERARSRQLPASGEAP